MIVFLAWMRNQFFDSKVYYGAVHYWMREHGMVYDWLKPGTPYGFTYPPFAGLTMAPMAYLPFWLVVVLATVGSVLTTIVLTWWFTWSVIKTKPWTRWYAFSIACCLALAFEPIRETISFGQVNTILLTLVAGDLLFGLSSGRRWAGVGIGLATAIKLTPGVFILYLLITRRWRAAATAIGTAGGATFLGGALFPDESREFWTSAIWDTNRVGVLSYVSNQSERGLIARLPLGDTQTRVWFVCVLLTIGVWAWRVRKERDDIMAGLAMTGILGCLISPVTWVHHCVWLLPAIVRCVASANRRRRNLGLAAYAAMTSRLTWVWEHRPEPTFAFVGSNLYVWFSLALLIWTPIGAAHQSIELTPAAAADLASPNLSPHGGPTSETHANTTTRLTQTARRAVAHTLNRQTGQRLAD